MSANLRLSVLGGQTEGGGQGEPCSCEAVLRYLTHLLLSVGHKAAQHVCALYFVTYVVASLSERPSAVLTCLLPTERMPYIIQLARSVAEENVRPNLWRAGHDTVRRIETFEPSALLEVHVGPRKTRHYQQVWILLSPKIVLRSTS